ncbi:tRNA pseudouridine(38-40) synthase TruA [uncultured Anaerococcus sp.]|uniref:tRNA pseudouridine(38-40) synthase TruA n=1 Tax=uncultured Anaerococcus sp. TaxID=293428 RepID=UPI0025DB2E66|nr:tRNA pseudouridine(38-40) synthase TruA [uncultured Anaerococcus sp.]
MIKNVLVELAFDGRDFKGYQYQKDQRTVEKELKKAVNEVTGEDNRIIACGRTDAGVHAKKFYVNFLTASKINPKGFSYHIQPHLPDDIFAISSREVGLDFHARFSCKTKTYRYIIRLDKNPHPIYRSYTENISYRLDYDKLSKGLDMLKGKHDFRLFMKEDKDLNINTIRTIDECYYEKRGNILSIYFKANSFLHNQVRIMVGSLIDLSRGRTSLVDFKAYIDLTSDKRANPTLAPTGLYLWEVEY